LLCIPGENPHEGVISTGNITKSPVQVSRFAAGPISPPFVLSDFHH
jgi:hypothetical protein